MTREQLARELVRHLPTEAREKFAMAIVKKRDEIAASYAATFIDAVANSDEKPLRGCCRLDDYNRAANALLRVLKEPA